MLTHNDHTVANAFEIFEACKDSSATHWGFKEEPLPLEQMQELYRYMKACGKTTVLEVVAYEEDESLRGAHIAAECGVDILMGTIFSDEISAVCKECGITYMPFVGEISERPSVLRGSLESMVDQAKRVLERGADGIDLLGYRYTGDAVALNRDLVQAIDAPVCLAGSVNSVERLNEVKDANPWAFTIGGAFFEQRFGDSFANQIDKVCAYMADH